MYIRVDSLGFSSCCSGRERLTVKRNQAAQRALVGFDREIGPIFVGGGIMISIHPDAVVGAVGFEFSLYRGTDCLKRLRLRALREKTCCRNAREKNQEDRSGIS